MKKSKLLITKTKKDYGNSIIKDQKFIIPITLGIENYKVFGNISNCHNWQARIFLGNSVCKNGPNVGDMDDVGYVMISIDSNIIVPIARGDEHQMGYELINYFVEKNKIPHETYVPINHASAFYVYSSEDNVAERNKVKVALRKYLDYGGSHNLPIYVLASSSGSEYIVSIDDFLNDKKSINLRKNTLSTFGKKIVDKLESISRKYIKKDYSVFEDAYYILEIIEKNFLYSNISMSFEQFQKIKHLLLTAEAKNDFDLLGEIMFSSKGIKNSLHNGLKELSKELNDSQQNLMYADKVKVTFWGDVNYAIEEFNRLGNQY